MNNAEQEVLAICRADIRALCMRYGVGGQKPCRVVNMDNGWYPIVFIEGDTWEEVLTKMLDEHTSLGSLQCHRENCGHIGPVPPNGECDVCGEEIVND